MQHPEVTEAVQSRFQEYDWRLQATLVGWSIVVALLMVGIRLLAANTSLLTIAR